MLAWCLAFSRSQKSAPLMASLSGVVPTVRRGKTDLGLGDAVDKGAGETGGELLGLGVVDGTT